jgi:hypothetical protein
MKNSNDTSWDRTSDLPSCSAAPEPLCYPTAVPHIFVMHKIFSVTEHLEMWQHFKNFEVANDKFNVVKDCT